MERFGDSDDEIQLLDLPKVMTLVPVSKATLWRWIEQGKFPKPAKNGGRNFWSRKELAQWQRKIMRDRGGSDII